MVIYLKINVYFVHLVLYSNLEDVQKDVDLIKYI
jgi:hypothetical protein